MSKHRLWLLSLILIAFALRLTLLGEQSLWYDEGVTWMLSQMKLPDLIQWTAADIQPPLYYLLIWTTDIFWGDSEWALRFPSALFNTLTVPLLYALARRLFTPAPLLPRPPAPPRRRASAALLAVILFTLSPLMVYYSQEARMYTLLTFLSTLAGYLLLKAISNYQYPKGTSLAISNKQYPQGALLPLTTYQLPKTHDKPAHYSPRSVPTSYSLLYAFTAAAALYTHYFAAFLLIAHAGYALYILWQQHFSKPLLAQFVVAFGGAMLLFAPWLPTLLARLGDDPSYWPGALKLNEAVRKVLISFTAGETVFEQIGGWLALAYFGFLILSFVIRHPARSFVLRPSSRPTHHSSLFLLLWLLLPILLILTLSYQSPKFNPRYTLLAWPAFALLTAALLAPKHLPTATPYAPRATSPVPRFLSTLTLLFILATFTYSLFNWFTDPRFSKDDFQALAQFVRERQAPNETVLLSSGHLFPVWAYYSGWEGWTPLPWMLRLNVNRVTQLGIAAEIADAVKGKDGVWLVTWQDEVIDPNGVVPFWLDLIGERPDDAGDFWGVGLEHWRINPEKVALLHQSPIQRPVEFLTSAATSSGSASTGMPAFNFANQVDLLGYTQLSDTDLALFWRPRQPLPDNLILTLDLTDPNGFDWDRESLIGRPGAYLYPPSRWPVGEVVMTRHRLPWQIGAPPGLYTVEIGLGQADTELAGWDVLDEQGRPQRRTALLDFVNLSELVRPDSGPLPIDNDPAIDFLPILAVRRMILPQTAAQPGDRLLLALLWQAGEFNLDNVSVAFDVTDAAGQTHRVGASFTPSRQFNLPRWQPGDVVLGQYWLDIPPEAAPGPASLQLHLINVSGFFYDEVFPLAGLEILPTGRNFTPPESVDMPLQADFSGQATLLGADCPNRCRAAPGQPLTLTFYWQAEARFKTNYTIFTHLLGPDETVLINADHAPPKPTQGWVPGEIITDAVTLTIPAGLPPGDYAVEVGLYNAADPAFTRLPLANGDNRVILPRSLTVE